MVKQFKRVLLIGILVMSFTVQFGTDARALTPTISGKWCTTCSSICVGTLLKKLGKADEYVLNVELNNFDLEVVCVNNGGNADTSQGEARYRDLTVCAENPVTFDEIHNGTSTQVTEVETDDPIANYLNALQSADPYAGPCVNRNWTWEDFSILGFHLRLELANADGTDYHIVEADATLSANGIDWDLVTTCDSLTGPACPATSPTCS